MIATRRRIRFAGALIVVVALITMISPPSPANAATTCTGADLQPTLAESMVTQGVGGTGTASYMRLTRGEDTLVKLFLTLPCSVTGSQYVRITNASLTVSIPSGAAPNTLITSFASTPAVPTITTPLQGNSPADPVFVVPAANLVPAPVDSDFTATFTATVTYSFSDGTVAGTGTANKTFPTFTKPFDAANALRVYVVPMGDASQAYSTQYTALDQTIVQNAMQTLSRIYPTTGGVGPLLDTATTGVRFIVDTSAMLDLKSISNSYVTSGSNSRFCGTSVNFSAIKGLLAQYLLTYNKANRNRTADRVVGVVGGNTLTGGRISWGTEDSASVGGCADGMASVSSAESWVRLVPDQSGAPSRSGALAAMEVSHTFGLEQTPSYHSSNVEADAGTDRAYNLSGRSRIAADHSVMNYNNTGSLWNNDTTLLEANDFAYLFCKLRPSQTTGCSSPGKIGTSTGQAAGEKYIIAGVTDGTPGNTKVIEPYYALDVAETDQSGDSLLRLLQLDKSVNPPTVVANFGMPWGEAVTDHDAVGDATPIKTGVRTFYAAAPGFSTAAGEVRLVNVQHATDLPKDSVVDGTAHEVTLFSSLEIAQPTISSLGVSNPPPISGGTVKLGRSQITPRIPPKPDIVFLADTTGSMTPNLNNVKNNAVAIMNQVLAAQPDAEFAVASYQDKEHCPQDAYMFKLGLPLTPGNTDTGKTAIQSAINDWQIGDGCDFPEAQLNALYLLGVGNPGGDPATSVGYRAGSSRVVAWFGDAPGHDPSGGHTESDAINALRGGETVSPDTVRVVAVSIENPTIHTTLNLCVTFCSDPAYVDGQATRIAAATDGVVKSTNNAADVSQAILDGLHDLPITVTPVVTAAACDTALLSPPVAFSPPSRTVTSGTTADFAETVTVAPTTAGRHTCEVRFKLNDQFQSDPAYTQVISIDVGGTQQKYVEVSANSDQPDRLLLDLIYECAASGAETNPFSFVAAVAVPPTAVTATTATFNTNADTTNACARSGGGGTLVPYVSDGWNRVAGTAGTGTTAETDTLSKNPTAAIYSPSITARIRPNDTLSLRGSGHVAGVELPESALSWSLVAPPSQPTAPGSGDVGTGGAIDKRAPTPGGWATGTWTIRLTATWEGRTATATRTFDIYQFIGFLAPVANPPLINTGTAGKTFALKWQLKLDGTFVSDLATVTSTKYEPVSACDPSAATGQFAMTSGQSELKYVDKDKQFVFNWQTPSTTGLYLFRLTLIDGSTHDACVNLTKK